MVEIILVDQQKQQQINTDNKEKLEQIEKLRVQMYQQFKSTKNRQEVVDISQELDKLIYEFITSSHKKSTHNKE